MEMHCDESKPTPLWQQVLLVVAPVIAGVAGELVKEWLAHRRAQRAGKGPKPS